MRRGYIATHARAWLKTARVELAALADLDPERVDKYARKFEVTGRYTDYREMLAAEGLDILSVCTQNSTHREIVEHAAGTGLKAIFCEKPIADTLAAADVMIDACQRNGVVLMVNHKRRFDRFHREAAEFIHQGRLGRIQQVTCYYTAGIANTCTHLFDLLRDFLGEVEWVRGVPSRIPSPNERDPNIDGFLQFADGPRVAIQTCDVREYTIFEVNVLGTKGRLRIMAHGFEAQFEDVRDHTRFTGYHALHAASLPIDASGNREYFVQAAAHLADCLDDGHPPACTGEDGRKTMELIFALLESAEHDGQRVTLPFTDTGRAIPSR